MKTEFVTLGNRGRATSAHLPLLKPMTLTPTQQKAIAARGNVLVVAGAGTGKTRTLVERCLNCLLEEKPRASLDEILMVTFTDAAAAEMRQRIRARLEEEWNKAVKSKQPDAVHWAEQLAIFETAHVGTLHSFCLQLVRQHFYELKLDPQLTVLAEEEAFLLAEETLDALLHEHYAKDSAIADAVQSLIQEQGRGWDKPIRTLILRLHHYTQTLHDPARWFAGQLEMFDSEQPVQWESWLLDGVRDWRESWRPNLERRVSGNAKAAECAGLLKQLPENFSRADAAAILDQAHQAGQNFAGGKKAQQGKPLGQFFAEAAFLCSLATVTAKGDPLAQDWSWVRSHMTTLLGLAQEFQKQFSETKRERGVVDFHDLEQFALDLLWDRKQDQPTAIAVQWRKKIRFVFVDEYQDINQAQDKIIQALSRDDAKANRFLVGDVKQSIYRFRLANPRIFQNYIETWRDGAGQAIPLVDNFRSRESILNFVNSVFTLLMHREVGGVGYDGDAQLRFGAPNERALLSVEANAAPRVELHLCLKGKTETADAASDEEIASVTPSVLELADAEKEARIVALRLRELKVQQHEIWDDDRKILRPVDWSDMAVLLRAPANKAESYAKEFERAGVPLTVARGGFYQSMEVLDLLSLLQLLDNPLQDVPALAVLHSPLVGLALDELSLIRLALPKGSFWAALRRWHEAHSPESRVQSPGSESVSELLTSRETFRKVEMFLTRFAQWRRLARQVSLSRCLEAVLGETHYAEWALTQSRGDQRHANVHRLLGLAQQFDQFQQQGLFRFLRFIEAEREAEMEPEITTAGSEEAVTLMSIHQSKGLEFPVVAVVDLGKPFNLLDLGAGIILDEVYGLCPQVQPPDTGRRYPSLPYWLARQRQKQEILGEELRLLYVAMTRARDTLILSGSVSPKKFQQWKGDGEFDAGKLLSARGYLDWIGAWFARNVERNDKAVATSGENHLLRWTVCDGATVGRLTANAENLTRSETATFADAMDAKSWRELQTRLAWQYPYRAATQEPAKTSVSALRRRMAEEADLAKQFRIQSPKRRVQSPESRAQSQAGALIGKISAADIGTIYHAFLQRVSMDCVGSTAELEQEAQRLAREKVLTAEETSVLDFAAVAAFWKSDFGQRIWLQRKFVRRELEFTVRFSPNDLAALLDTPAGATLANEFVVVQGVADLAVLLPEEIWLVDFKTDQLETKELEERIKAYEPQLTLYARALEQIYWRPVSERWLHFFTLHRSVAVEDRRQRPVFET